jgi:cytochrome b6-f complex iron-sulfur subunit
VNATVIIVIAVAAAVVLGAITFLTLARRSDVRGAGALSHETIERDRAARAARPAEAAAAGSRAEVEAAGARARTGSAVVKATEVAPAPWVPPDPEAVGVSRRMFFNRASVTLMTAGIGAFTAASFVAFLWPFASGGFGGKVPVGNLTDLIEGIRNNDGFFYRPEARSWLTEYPSDALPKAEGLYPEALMPGMRAGIIAQYQKCPHLGCRVPSCPSSQWFECPCHGSQYNQVGEKKGGPAPRGMDHFALTISAAGDVTIDTGVVIAGLPIGTNTTGQEAEGPHCVGQAGEH